MSGQESNVIEENLEYQMHGYNKSNVEVFEDLLLPVMRNVVGRFLRIAEMKSSHSDSGTISCRL